MITYLLDVTFLIFLTSIHRHQTPSRSRT